MDRTTVNSGELPRTVDFLQAQQNTMVALAKLSLDLLGNAGVACGFGCGPTTPASLAVSLAAGTVYQVASLEATTWSALNPDTTHQILKQGIALDAQAITLTPPATTGYSQVFLIEVQYDDEDANPVVLPYYNAANPAAPFSGPGNSGAAQNTARKGVAAVQVKAGIAAPTGTQASPSQDSGWLGLWYVTLAQGQSTITSGDIAQYPNAPFVSLKLPNVAAFIQAGTPSYCVDSSVAANTIDVAPAPAPASITAGMCLNIKVANDITTATTIVVTLASGSTQTNALVNSLGADPASGQINAGSILVVKFDGSNWQFLSATGGVSSLNALTGALGIAATGGDVVAASGTAITIASPGGTRNRFRNGTMDIWQRGTPLTVTTAAAYTADGWIVSPTGASVTVSKAAGRSLTVNSLEITGASSVSDVTVKQRIESCLAAIFTSQTVTVQAQIFNQTGGSITPTLTVKHATAQDNWASSTTDVNAVNVQACPNGSWTRVAYSFAASAAAANGLEVTFDLGNNFSSSGKTLQITELDIRVTPGVTTGLNGAPPPPELRPIASELALCQRYFASSYDLGTAPGTATHSGIVGISASTGGQLSKFPVPMRAAPGSVSYWDGAGTANRVAEVNAASFTDGSTPLDAPWNISTTGFFWTGDGSFPTALQYTASAEL